MRIRITKRPDPVEFVEFEVRQFHTGEVHDVASHLAMLLIVAGNAEPALSAVEYSEAADGPGGPRRGPKQLS